MRRSTRWLAAFLTVSIGLVVGLAPLAQAAGSGYNLSYNRAAGAASDSSVDLVAVSTSDPGGAQISVTFTVSGHLKTTSPSYGYYVFFGGGGTSNSTAYVSFVNNASYGNEYSGTGFGAIPYTLGNGGASLTFKINKTDVGSPSTFSVNAWAYSGSYGSGSGSWLGTNYSGGSNCTQFSCLPNSSTASNVLSTLAIIGIIVLVVIVVVVVVVVVLVMRSHKPPPTMMPGGQMYYPAPGAPGQPMPPGYPPQPGPPMPPPPAPPTQ